MFEERKTEDVSKWVSLYSNYLYSYCLGRVNDTELANDLVQDTFVAGLQALDRFEGKSEIKTWLISILKRKIVDHWRRIKSHQTYAMSNFFYSDSQQIWNEKLLTDTTLSDIEINIFNNELKDTLNECISSLPIKWKQVFIDKMINHNDSEAVCIKNNITASNFWVIMHRSKLKMRVELEKKGFN